MFIKEGGLIIATVLHRLFVLSLETAKVPKSFKQANVIPIHKKEVKTIVSNYRPISLLSTLSKILEKIVFKYVYNFFKDNFVLSIYQSGFQSGMSTVTQLIEVYHHFCQAVENGKEIRVVFLDISKAFDKVWHSGLLFKLEQCGIGGQLLAWFKDYLKDRIQRVIINGQQSQWKNINCGVPQGSVLGPLLFLLYINDISNVVTKSHIRLFADDTCLFIEVDNREQAAQDINSDLQEIQQWANKWLITFSPPKTKSLLISNKQDVNQSPHVSLNGHDIDEIQSHTYLGLRFSNDLKWTQHIDDISIKARKCLNLMIPLKFKLDKNSLETIYCSFVMPTMEYANVVWGGSSDGNISKLEKIHVDGMRLVTGATAKSNIKKLYTETTWHEISKRIDDSSLIMLYKIKNNLAPQYLVNLYPGVIKDTKPRTLRNQENIASLPGKYLRLEIFRNSFIPRTIKLWNSLPKEKQNIPSLDLFKNSIRQKEKEINVLYYYGKRWPSVHHARLRLGCSKLNYDLCKNLHVIENQDCSCGSKKEDAFHYFMTCPNYMNIRIDLFSAISIYSHVTLPIILNGNPKLELSKNKFIFDAVHTFLNKSKRFQ